MVKVNIYYFVFNCTTHELIVVSVALIDHCTIYGSKLNEFKRVPISFICCWMVLFIFPFTLTTNYIFTYSWRKVCFNQLKWVYTKQTIQWKVRMWFIYVRRKIVPSVPWLVCSLVQEFSFGVECFVLLVLLFHYNLFNIYFNGSIFKTRKIQHRS